MVLFSLFCFLFLSCFDFFFSFKLLVPLKHNSTELLGHPSRSEKEAGMLGGWGEWDPQGRRLPAAHPGLAMLVWLALSCFGCAILSHSNYSASEHALL